MARTVNTRIVLIGMGLGIFTLGYLAGSVSTHRAEGLGGVLDQAGKAGGSLSALSDLGTSIGEMQENVNGLQKNVAGLQKNLDILKKVQAALTGK